MSTLVIDTIQGKTTAGSVNVRGEGSNNTNLQQGLAKCWIGGASHTAGAIQGDTFNQSSYEDTATGRGRVSMTNGVNNDYSVVMGCESQYPYRAFNVSSTQFEISTVDYNGTFADGANNAAVFGDLT